MNIEGISADELLMNEFIRHEKGELVHLDNYKTILNETPPPLVKFLLQLIISDEEKHHALIYAMISSIKGSLEWTTPDGAIGKMGQISEAERSELLQITAEFIEEEKKGIKEFNKLLKNNKEHRAGLFGLLLQTITHDSQKHLMILKFLEKKLEKS